MNEELVKVDDIRAEVAPVLQRAQSIVIATPDDYIMASEWLKTVKGAIKRVDAFFDPMVRANLEATRRTNEAKASVRAPLVQAEGMTKDKQLVYEREQEAIRKKEEDRLNALEAERVRKEREKAEAAARLQREKEAAAQREADEARRKAAATKNAAERERLQREAEVRQKAANEAAAKAQAKEEAAANVQANSVTVFSTTPEIKGQSTRKTWKARIVNAALIPREWLVPNLDAINAFAKSTKGAMTIPGVEMYEESSKSSTSK
jgi:hypothetical protein